MYLVLDFLLSVEEYSVYYSNEKQPMSACFACELGLIRSSMQVPKWVSHV